MGSCSCAGLLHSATAALFEWQNDENCKLILELTVDGNTGMSCLFVGSYDWAGTLDMTPDPFVAWNITSIDNTNRRHRMLLQPDNTGSSLGWSVQPSLNPDSALTPGRLLLQDNDYQGNLPVQGRVSVREAVDPNAGSASGGPFVPASLTALDDDMFVFYPVPPNASDPGGMYYAPATSSTEPQLPQSVQDAFAAIARAFTDPKNRNTIILAVSLAASLCGALCAILLCAGIARRKRKRASSEKQAAKAKEGQARHDNIVYHDGSGNVQTLQPGDFVYGSVDGRAGMLPPSLDSSADGSSAGVNVAGPRTFENRVQQLEKLAEWYGCSCGPAQGPVWRCLQSA
jgi:hypothetical protein